MASGSIFLLLLTFFSSRFNCLAAQTWVQAGHWYANGDFPMTDINSALFTHLFCSFAEVKPSTNQVFIPSLYEKHFSTFSHTVKRKNPSVKTLISVWNGYPATASSVYGEKVSDSVLSSMIVESTNRKSFIDSSIRTARLYGFDGILLSWVWPNSTDLSYMGDLLDEWRAAITSEQRNQGNSRLILTMAVRYLPTIGTASYPIDSISRNVDWVHVTAYDYHLPRKEKITGFHAALYNPSSNVSTDFGIREWLSKGFQANKLVLGLPYHGYAWKLENPQENAVGSPSPGPAITEYGAMPYKNIKSYIRDNGYGIRSVYNASYAVNLFTTTTAWINFDDVETIKQKVAYAKEKGLIGYIAFQLAYDDNWELSRAGMNLFSFTVFHDLLSSHVTHLGLFGSIEGRRGGG